MKPDLTLRGHAATAPVSGATGFPIDHPDMASGASAAPAVVLPTTMAGAFDRLRTRGKRLLTAGALAGVGGAVLVAGGLYGLAGAGHLLPTTLTAVDLPAGLHAASEGGGGPLSATIATGMGALASIGGTMFRFTMCLTALCMLVQALHRYVVAAKEEEEGEGASPLLSLLLSGALMLGAWGAPKVVDAVSVGTGVNSREGIVSAIRSGTFEPAMVEDVSDGGMAYLLAQRAQWQLQRPGSDRTSDLDARHLASLRATLARIPAATPVDPGIRYVLERAAHGRAQSEAAKAYEVETTQAARRAQRWGRIGAALGGLLLATGIGLAGLGSVIAARVRRVQRWLPAETAR